MLPLSPSKLGRYEIVDEIGKGAMGVVYLARDPLIGRLVALKTFRISYSVKDAELEQFRARFIREAQSAGILSHPNIVTIHDVVERGEEGLAFIAMEYVRGTNLKSVLQEPRRQTLTFVCEILSQIADGLDYAHSCKVIHRDIKPANILITGDNRAKITDFGIARLDTSNLTQEGQLLGTPNYMSPEQILGRDVDHRADIFSLGVVLYEMVTRHKPFQGENLTVVSHRIVYDHFTPPRDYADDLPPGTEQILAKALEKDPARRYQRARDMADDLRRVLGSVGVRDTLNETQSLSTTAMLPAQLLRPAAPAAAAAVAAAPLPAEGWAPLTPVGPLDPPARVQPNDPRAASDPRAPTVLHGAPAAPPAPAAAGSRASLWRRLTRRESDGGEAALGAAPSPRPAAAVQAMAEAAPRAAAPPAESPRAVPPPAPLAPAGSPGASGSGDFDAWSAAPAADGSAAFGTVAGAETAVVAGAPAAAASPGVRPGAFEAAAATVAAVGERVRVGAPRPVPRLAPAAPAPDGAAPPATAPYRHGTRPMAVPTDLAGVGAAAPPSAASQPAATPEVASLPAAPAPAAVPSPPRHPPATPGQGLFAIPSPARLAMAAAAGLGAGLLLAASLVLWTRSGPAPAPGGAAAARPEASQVIRQQVLALVREGRRRLDAGDADGAAAALRAAEQLLPGRRALRQLREEAERRQGDRRQRLDQERTIEAKLDEGRLALAGRHYSEAEAAAQAVLAMSPGNTVAAEILASVKEGRARSKDRAAAAEARLAARTVAVATPPVRPDAAPHGDQLPPPAEVKDATLELAFFSQLPEGTLLVYINGRKVLQEPFRFYEKSGLFRSRPSTGWVRRSFHVAAGSVEVRLYVTPHDSAAVVRTLSGNFPGGAARRLDVKLTDGGEVSAQLN